MIRIFFLLLCCQSAYSQLPDISFNGNNTWTANSNVAFNVANNEVSISNNGSANVFTSLTTTISNPPSEFFLIADIQLQNVVYDPATIRNPYIVIRNSSGNVLYRYTLKEDLENSWFKSGIKISNYSDSNNQIKVEFGINQAAGVMLVKNPTLSETPPSFVYEFPFPIPNDVTTTLDVDLSQKHDFENDLLSSNTHFVFAKVPWSNAALQSSINAYFPMSNLRFPGGSVGNFYNYQTDNFFINSFTSNNLITYNNQGHTLDYNGYNAFCQSSGATSTYMLNVMFNSVASAQSEYQNRFNSGLPIKWVELGNEMYLSQNQVGPYITNISSYLTYTQQLSNQLKAINPDVKVAVCLEKDDFNVGEWNYILSQNQTYFDAATLHNYIALDHYFYSKYISYGVLTSYKKSISRFLQYQQLFPSKPLLLTEWGITGNVDEPYFIQTLGIADSFLAIEKANEMNIVKQAGIHMLYKNNANDTATLMYFDANNQLRLTSKGQLYSKLFEVFKDAEVYNAETTSSELVSGLKAVNAKMVKKGNVYKILAVNKLPVVSPFVLNINGVNYNGNYTIENLTGDMSSVVNGQLATSNVWEQQVLNGAISLPPSSISVITIQESELQNLININFSNSELIVYPNPVANVVMIANLSNFNNYRFELYNAFGKIIDYGILKNYEGVNMSKLSSGFYLLKIFEDSENITSLKVIKK